jgi:P27 family predicted phage terminase small subunit
MRGRKPKPSYLRVLDGNAGHRPLNPDEPQPTGDLIEPPEWMTDSQKAGWRYAIRNAPGGLLRLLDQSILSAWVCAEDLHRTAAEKVARIGALVKVGEHGAWQQNPYLPIMNKQALIMMKAAAEMGFTPSSRTRVRVERDRGKNPFADLQSLDDE